MIANRLRLLIGSFVAPLARWAMGVGYAAGDEPLIRTGVGGDYTDDIKPSRLGGASDSDARCAAPGPAWYSAAREAMDMREVRRTEYTVVYALGPAGAGGAPSDYEVVRANGDGVLTFVDFQVGCPAEQVNGATNEDLLSIVVDRLEQFQRGPFSCAENQAAIGHIRLGIEILERRTRERRARGVEGRHVQ